MAARLFYTFVVLLVNFYTLSYMVWLWRDQKKKGAVGVLFLAVVAIVYPIFVAFFIWSKFG